MKPKGAQVGGSVGALGGPPAHQPTQWGEQTLAPARFILTCRAAHKTTLSMQRIWIAGEKQLPVGWDKSKTIKLQWRDRNIFVSSSQPKDDQSKWDNFGLYNLKCPICAKDISKAQEIKGIWSTEVACNFKCIDSEGPKCSCSCGGENHGTGRMLFFETKSKGPTIEVVLATPPAPTPAQRHPQASSLEPPPKAEQLSLFANPRRRRAP